MRTTLWAIGLLILCPATAMLIGAVTGGIIGGLIGGFIGLDFLDKWMPTIASVLHCLIPFSVVALLGMLAAWRNVSQVALNVSFTIYGTVCGLLFIVLVFAPWPTTAIQMAAIAVYAVVFATAGMTAGRWYPNAQAA